MDIFGLFRRGKEAEPSTPVSVIEEHGLQKPYIAIAFAMGEEKRGLRHYDPENVLIQEIGIGKVNAARAVTLMLERGVEAVIVGGVCAALPGYEIGETFFITEAVQYDYGHLRSEKDRTILPPGKLPPATGAHVYGMTQTYYDLVMKINQSTELLLNSKRIATGDSFITSLAVAKKVSEQAGADLFDMEIGAIAQVCERSGIPWFGIKTITDIIGAKKQTEDFANNLKRATEINGKIVREVAERLLIELR